MIDSTLQVNVLKNRPHIHVVGLFLALEMRPFSFGVMFFGQTQDYMRCLSPGMIYLISRVLSHISSKKLRIMCFE